MFLKSHLPLKFKFLVKSLLPLKFKFLRLLQLLCPINFGLNVLIVRSSLSKLQIPLSGIHSILGRAVVVHADPDDLGKGKIFNLVSTSACCIISQHSSGQDNSLYVIDLFWRCMPCIFDVILCCFLECYVGFGQECFI